MFTIEQWKSFAIIIVARQFGVVAHGVNKYLEAVNTTIKRSRKEIFAMLFLASFGGLITGLITQFFTHNVYCVAVAAWIGWFAWVAGLNIIKETVIGWLINVINRVFNSKTKQDD